MHHSPAFLRQAVRNKLVVSTCVLCHRTAASRDEHLLGLVEKAHACPKLQHAERRRETEMRWPIRKAK